MVKRFIKRNTKSKITKVWKWKKGWNGVMEWCWGIRCMAFSFSEAKRRVSAFNPPLKRDKESVSQNHYWRVQLQPLLRMITSETGPQGSLRMMDGVDSANKPTLVSTNTLTFPKREPQLGRADHRLLFLKSRFWITSTPLVFPSTV